MAKIREISEKVAKINDPIEVEDILVRYITECCVSSIIQFDVEELGDDVEYHECVTFL